MSKVFFVSIKRRFGGVIASGTTSNCFVVLRRSSSIHVLGANKQLPYLPKILRGGVAWEVATLLIDLCYGLELCDGWFLFVCDLVADSG